MADLFASIDNFRNILDTETDADSPDNETTYGAIRMNIETLLMATWQTAAASTCTSDPSNDANGYFYDTVPSWTNDSQNGRLLVITNGNGKGQIYEIDDTTAASDRLSCTGDNIYADGVRSGDGYIIFYDFRDSGHDHDGINSASLQAFASQSDQETGTEAAKAVTPSVQQYHQSASKGWGKANAAGAIQGTAYNCTVSDIAAGRITYTWGTDFSSTNYGVEITVRSTGFVAARVDGNVADLAGAITFICEIADGTDTDPSFWYAAAFGDQA
ncbi:MAG: hypothetical protein GY841_12420 [FCB group bacterium]|nr:hypothetical protein [FCB group bacterium]